MSYHFCLPSQQELAERRRQRNLSRESLSSVGRDSVGSASASISASAGAGAAGGTPPGRKVGKPSDCS